MYSTRITSSTRFTTINLLYLLYIMPIQLNCNECLYKRCVSDICTLYCACLVDNLLLCQDCYISKMPLEYFERCNKDVYCKLCNLKCHDLRCIIE